MNINKIIEEEKALEKNTLEALSNHKKKIEEIEKRVEQIERLGVYHERDILRLKIFTIVLVCLTFLLANAIILLAVK